MAITVPTRGQQNWDVTLNTALNELETEITTNATTASTNLTSAISSEVARANGAYSPINHIGPVAVSGTPSVGQAPVATSSSTATWQTVSGGGGGSPTGAAGGDLVGSTYPNPLLANTSNVQTIVQTNRLDQMASPTSDVSLNSHKIVNMANGIASTDGAAFGQVPVIGAAGSGAGKALSANDSTTTNARTPTSHASTHFTGGSDPLTPANIGALATSSSAGGDATGTLSSLSVVKVNGTSVPATPSAGQVLTATNGTTATWQTPGGSAWVFDVVKSYGAKADGKMVHDGAMGSGGTTLTCATSAPFLSSDTGKSIMIKGAGNTAVTSLIGTMTYISATQVTVSVANAAVGAVSGCQVYWGTDDTAAINSAVTAASTYAQAHGGLAKIYFPAATNQFYVIAGAKSNGATLGNAQIPLPIIPTTANKVTLIFEGAGNASAVQHWQQTVTQTSGTTLISFGVYSSGTAQTNDINANGNPSVIGGPTPQGGYGIAPGIFNNIYPVIKDMAIRTAHSAEGLTWGAWDFWGCAEGSLQNFTYGTTGTVVDGDFVNPNVFATNLAIGGLMPAPGNNDNSWTSNVTCQGGYTYAMFIPEHFVADRLCILYCWSAACIVGNYNGSVGSTHAINLGQASIEACINVINVIGIGSGGQGPWLFGILDTEGTLTINDNTSGNGLNALLGEVQLVGLITPSTFTLTHPTGLKIVNGLAGSNAIVKTGNYDVNVLDENILVDATAGPVTITLIDAAWTPNVIHVEKIDSSVNAVTVSTLNSQTIGPGGATTKVLSTEGSSVTVFSARVSSVWKWRIK